MMIGIYNMTMRCQCLPRAWKSNGWENSRIPVTSYLRDAKSEPLYHDLDGEITLMEVVKHVIVGQHTCYHQTYNESLDEDQVQLLGYGGIVSRSVQVFWSTIFRNRHYTPDTMLQTPTLASASVIIIFMLLQQRK